MGNIQEEFIIKTDGTIERTLKSGLDAVLLNIIRVGANQADPLAAFKAQQKCYKIFKKTTQRVDYREYVQGLQLDNYPLEFRKAEKGRIVDKHDALWIVLCCFIIGLLFLPLYLHKRKMMIREIQSLK